MAEEQLSAWKPLGHERRHGDWWPIEPSYVVEHSWFWESWALSDDYDPPRPKKAAEIARLGDELDEVEGLPDWRSEMQDAAMAYFLAVRGRLWAEMAKVRRCKVTPTRADGIRLDSQRRQVREAFDVMTELGSGATMRELIDARAALALTDYRFRDANRKYHRAQRLANQVRQEVQTMIRKRTATNEQE